MVRDTGEYLSALKELKKKWDSCVDFHAYMHKGKEHEHSLEEDFIDLEKYIITVYQKFGVKKIGRYTKKGMLQEVAKLRKRRPGWALDTVLVDWQLPPHHPVRRELELVIVELEASVPLSTRVEPINVDEKAMEVILGDSRSKLTGTELLVLKRLIEKQGEWVSGKLLKSTPDSEERPDRIVKKLNLKLDNRIETSRDGYRLT